MSIKSSALFAVGDEVRIKSGASAWMKAHNYWIHDWPESVDGMIGTILHDYTQYAGNDCHYEVAIDGVNGCGVHPQWLTANAPAQLPVARPSARVDVIDVRRKHLDELDAAGDGQETQQDAILAGGASGASQDKGGNVQAACSQLQRNIQGNPCDTVH